MAPRPKESSSAQVSAQAQQDAVSEGIDAFELPRSLVTRIARSALPENVKLQKEVVLALLKGSTVFINYIAATAHDVATSKQHKSVAASDILKALELAQFGDMLTKLQEEQVVFHDNYMKSKKAAGKTKGKEPASISAATLPNPKGKGKEKAKAVLAPTITIPGARSAASATHHPPSEPEEPGPEEEEVDEEEVPRVNRYEGDGEEMLDAGPEEEDGPEDEDEEDIDEGDEDEDEEIVDTMGVEDEELREDARGVEERDAVA